MSYDSTRAGTREREGGRNWKSAKDVSSAASALAEEATSNLKQAASETTATVTGGVKELLNRQLASSANTMGSFARSVEKAADDLGQESPQIAGLVRTFASRVDGYADDLREQSIEDLWNSAAAFTRRQPALVFGLAAVAGFFALRTLKSTPSVSSPSIQPSHSSHSGRRAGSYGS
jgi:ABC-type transporter Mla subunit MlaD